MQSTLATATHQHVGRFAPSPTGRMHLGNIATALLSWLSVKSVGGRWILRIEDLDPQRSRREYSELIEDDLHWLGLDWDEGGLSDKGSSGPYSQSRRSELYARALEQLRQRGLTYPCTCTRADIMAASAPQAGDGRVVYSGRCRPAVMPRVYHPAPGARAAERVYVADGTTITFTDRVYGVQTIDLSRECGDFIVRRADGAWAYQLAVVVDDALMGVTEVVRGCDLLSSAAQQIWLYRVLGYREPEFMHLPILCNAEGRRLSKRDGSLAMDALRQCHSPSEVVGMAAAAVGLIDLSEPITPDELLEIYRPELITRQPIVKF